MPPVAFVVGGARSGTTLVRLLLDAHPQIACPSETGMARALDNLAQVWWALSPVGRWPYRADRLTDDISDQVRRVVSPALSHYCNERRKTVYCDKSLDSISYLDTAHAVFPDAKFVIVVRHVMDVIASGIEASPWGFASYGYAPFVRASPDNVVAALARHWLMHIEPALAWRHSHSHLCMTVRYEDLVTESAATLQSIFAFLNVDDESDCCIQSLADQPRALGRGDYKIGHTDRIHGDSVGRGRRIPLELLPPPLLHSLNGRLHQLGYGVIDAGWNAEVMTRSTAGTTTTRASLEAIMGRRELREVDPTLEAFAVAADDDPDLRWVVDARHGLITPGDGVVEFALLGSSHDLLALFTGSINAGVLLRSGRIRYLKDADEVVAPDDPGIAVERARAIITAPRSPARQNKRQYKRTDGTL